MFVYLTRNSHLFDGSEHCLHLVRRSWDTQVRPSVYQTNQPLILSLVPRAMTNLFV